MEPYWRDGSMDLVKFIVHRAPHKLIALEHVGYSGRLQKLARTFLQDIKQNNIPPKKTIRY